MRKKWSIILLVTFCLAFFLQPLAFPEQAYAAESGELVDDDLNKKLDEAEKEMSFFDKTLLGLARTLFNIPGINSLHNLVFGNPYEVWLGIEDSKVSYDLFTNTELNYIIKPLIGLIASIFVAFITIAIMVSALKMGLRSYNPQARADFWTDVQMWVLAGFFMGTFGYILDILLFINEALVAGVQQVFGQVAGKLGATNGKDALKTSTSIMMSMKSADKLTLGDVFVMLAEWGLSLYLNIIYISRKIIITLLVILAPIAAISLLYARSRAFFGTWFRELAGNIFLQSIHSIILFAFAGMATSAGTGVGAYIFQLGMIIMFVPVSGMVSSWLNLGDSSTKLGQTATMVGMGSLAGMAMLARGAKGVMSGARNGGMTPGGMNGNGGGFAGELGDDGALTGVTRSAVGGSTWEKAKKAGSGVGALLGGTTGLAIGPGGVAAGALLGSKVGRAATSAVRRVPSGLGASGSAINQIRSADTPIDRRQAVGNLGEAVGSMVGLESFGRQAGFALSGVSRGSVMDSLPYKSSAEVGRALTGTTGMWKQTRDASWIESADGKVISMYGAGDMNLGKDDTRVMPLSFSDPAQVKMSENGSFSKLSGGEGSTGGKSEVVGPSGSTPGIMRTTGSFIQQMDKDGHTRTLNDASFDAKRVNFDSYYSGGTGNQSGSDRVAGMIGASHKAGQQAAASISAWKENRQSMNTNQPQDKGRRFS